MEDRLLNNRDPNPMAEMEGKCYGNLREGCDLFRIYGVGRAADFEG